MARHAQNHDSVGKKGPTDRPDSCLLVVNGVQAGGGAA